MLVFLQVLLSLNLGNTAFEDEALYIQAGKDLLAHWQTGVVAPDYGVFFSGAPLAYPLLAGFLDRIGGLELVRSFSMACIVVAMLSTRATAAHVFSQRAGDLTGFAFAVTGPVVFLSALATFDALCLMLLSVALRLAVTQTSRSSAVLVGLALAAATVVKYTSAVFLPVVLAMVLVAAGRQTGRNRLVRFLTAALVTAVAIGLLYGLWGREVHDGIVLTTASREVLNPTPNSQLAGYFARDIGLLTLLALVGGYSLIRSLRSALLVLLLFTGAFALVLSHLHLGESVSFEKHLAYSALFLAPLAGRSLAYLAKSTMHMMLLAALMVVMLVSGTSRAGGMYQWPNVEPVVAVVMAENPEAGMYLSTQAYPLRYHTWDEHPEIQWVPHYNIAASSPEAIRQSVEDGTYEMFVWSADSAGSSAEDPQIAVLRQAVQDSPRYRLVTEPFRAPAWGGEQVWHVYELKG
ncbi:ArnT family glycosyltransferase [Kocuria cellulosilytica]|uniref:ArnT family glycosyltransferase n=1 Tax=Kocuria cellulosilytica TaxID=3071451 RepID=UPI0034D3E863